MQSNAENPKETKKLRANPMMQPESARNPNKSKIRL
jgi:hypothetical protein